jgi:hypothetical protein
VNCQCHGQHEFPCEYAVNREFNHSGSANQEALAPLIRFTAVERLVLHDAAEALECDIKHQHSQGCNELSVQLRAMLAESERSVNP